MPNTPKTSEELLKQLNLTPEQLENLRQQVEKERCRRDIAYYVRNYVKIENVDSAEIAVPFDLWPAQLEVLKKLSLKRLIQILKARQLGLTWLALAYISHKLLYNPGFLTIALSKNEDDAKELVRRIDFILKYLPQWFFTGSEGKLYNKTTESITLYHFDEKGKPKESATFQSFPSSQNAGRSFTANIVLLDEWAFQQWAREIWKAAFPTINRPTGGQVIGISTIERGTLFEELWKDKENDFEKIFLGWDSDPRRSQEWYESTKRNLKGDIRSEYPATEEEALAIPGGTYFSNFNSKIHIREPRETIPEYFLRYRAMDYGLDMLACYFIYVDTYGYARIYKEIHESKLVISAASYEILKASGAEVPESREVWTRLTPQIKRQIALTSKDKFAATFAPPDLFETSKENENKSLDLVWVENGIVLTKAGNKFEAGCLALSDWLEPFSTQNVVTGDEYKTSKLTIDKDCAPNLVYSLLNIQKDKNNPKVYSKTPHDLTHSIDAMRYFATGFIGQAINEEEEKRKREELLRMTAYPQVILNQEKVSDSDLQF